MEFVMHGLIAILIASALLAACAVRLGGLISARAHLYNGRDDAAGRR